MAKGVTLIDFDEIQALVRMAERTDPIVANIAKAALSLVEARRDAEIRAATAEAALATVRHILAAHDESDSVETLRQIAQLLF